MAHKESKADVPGRYVVDDTDVKYLVENTDLSPNQARELIEEHGNDRDKLMRLAKTMKAES
ncbi:hypothetical protein SAZ10_04920 [Mesorhizobium sp. BAC0120]|uniref:hypothetical protein n=1 Tax=Mesorhizobium sp. BAC0120 TaxID=3090670 RepID=UPI00298C9602|nr:hypothetical protein [Mesorhizobium sp. BAC0120]MDW6021102.1 hypothetical protein [Mesorhizobium sp. BAC0120]